MGKRGPKSLVELRRALRAARRQPIEADRLTFHFSDGTAESLPLALANEIDRAQRGVAGGIRGGKGGGRPSKRPIDSRLLLQFGRHWLESGSVYAVARKSFLRKVQNECKVSLLTARRWCDRALGRQK